MHFIIRKVAKCQSLVGVGNGLARSHTAGLITSESGHIDSLPRVFLAIFELLSHPVQFSTYE